MTYLYLVEILENSEEGPCDLGVANVTPTEFDSTL